MLAILFKVGLVAASALLGASALRTRLLDLPERHFRAVAVALQLIPALALFVGLYVIGHQEPTSDVPAYYLPAARAVLAGQVPFRDFTVSYAPVFAYVGAGLASIWNSGKVFALFAILLNGAALIWWHAAASAHFERSTVRACTILYATSGHVLVQALLGSNQAWVSAGLAASALLMVRDRDMASGLAQAAAACTTKVLAHLFWPVLWICAPRRYRWLLGAALPTAIVYGAFAALDGGVAGLLYPLRHEGELITPGNIPYLLDLALGGVGPLERYIYDGLALASLAIATVWLFSKAQGMAPGNRRVLLVAGLALTGLVFMLFSKKSFTGYILFVMYPVVLVLVAGVTDPRARTGFLLAFNVLLVAEPSLWFYLQGNRWTLRAWLAQGGGPAALAFVLLDLTLLGCYVYLAWLSVRAVERIVAGASASRNASQSATACSLV
jgi:hypothetical protein